MDNLKNYPFDDYWQIVISQTSTIQPNVHDLIVRRQAEKNNFPIAEALKSLPPLTVIENRTVL